MVSAVPIGEECLCRRVTGPPVENQSVFPALVDDPDMDIGLVGARTGRYHGSFSGGPGSICEPQAPGGCSMVVQGGCADDRARRVRAEKPMTGESGDRFACRYDGGGLFCGENSAVEVGGLPVVVPHF